MIRNYFIVAWRHLQKNKLYAGINILGLSVGISCCILIFLYVRNELCYDRHNVHAKSIYRLVEVLHLPKETRQQAATSPPMGPALAQNFPDIINCVRITSSGRPLSVNGEKIGENKLLYADSGFFDLFTHHVVDGNIDKALYRPYSIALTVSTAKKYFGKTQVAGETIMLSDSIPLTITAVIEDVPQTSHFTFDGLLSKSTLEDLGKNSADYQESKTSWFYNNGYTYLQLKEDADVKRVEKKINAYVHRLLEPSKRSSGMYYDFVLQPLTDIHLFSKFGSDISTDKGDILYVYIFSAAAFLILLIACFNFINLSTAKSVTRSKEIGLRKVIGARKEQLIRQFLGESFFQTLISAVLSVVFVLLALPYFNEFLGKELSFNIIKIPELLPAYLVVLFIAGFVAGLYPAFLLSSFAPVRSLKGMIRHGLTDIFLRKGLVVFQFSIALVLIVGSIMVLKQLTFMQETKLGMNRDQVIQIRFPQAAGGKEKLIRERFAATPGVIKASLSSFDIRDGISNITLLPEGAKENEITSEPVIAIDEHFAPAFDLQFVAGRNFSSAFKTDESEAFIVNETAVRSFGWGSPDKAVGKSIDWGLGKKGKVVGVVKDFSFKSLRDQMQPIILHIYPEWFGFMSVKVSASNLTALLSTLENTWQEVLPGSPFQYSFLDDDFSSLYKGEQNLQFILTVFTILASFIACLGLFGLAAFSIKQRFREIGVRKVLGANVRQISVLLSKEFLQLVGISVLFSIPVSWAVMSLWLRNFAFHVDLNAGVFIMAVIVCLLLAAITVCFQAMRAAGANPVTSLRTE